MGDGHVHLQATVTPKFISKIEPALRRKQQLQMAVAICRLGGTVFLNGAVSRVQANTESLFNNLIKEIQNMTEHNANVYPVRTDVPIKIQLEEFRFRLNALMLACFPFCSFFVKT